MGKTKIEWADYTWNPVSGCTKVSPGCANCYAEGIAARFWGGRKFTEVRCHPDRLIDLPVKPSLVFLCSMGDLFHEQVPDDFILQVFQKMCEVKQHTYMVLTKRAERMNDLVSWISRRAPDGSMDHIWLGVSVEDQPRADLRIPLLLQTPAAIRFVSAEPLLEWISIDKYFQYSIYNPMYNGRGIDWIIVGAETGTKARPCNPDWLRDLRDDCIAANLPFFLKKINNWYRELDGQLWEQYPERKSSDGNSNCYSKANNRR